MIDRTSKIQRAAFVLGGTGFLVFLPRIVAAARGVLGIPAPAFAVTPPPPPPPTASFSNLRVQVFATRITDTGPIFAELRNALVVLRDPLTLVTIDQGFTDIVGEVLLTNLVVGREYRVDVSASGYVPRSATFAMTQDLVLRFDLALA